VRFELDPAFETELAREFLPAAAEEVAGHAERFSRQSGRGWMPNRDAKRQPIQVGGSGEDVYVANHNHGAHLQEWGSRNNSAHAPLRRAVGAAGLRLEEE